MGRKGRHHEFGFLHRSTKWRKQFTNINTRSSNVSCLREYLECGKSTRTRLGFVTKKFINSDFQHTKSSCIMGCTGEELDRGSMLRSAVTGSPDTEKP